MEHLLTNVEKGLSKTELLFLLYVKGLRKKGKSFSNMSSEEIMQELEIDKRTYHETVKRLSELCLLEDD